MSSAYVRTTVKAFLAANAPTEDVIDLSGQFDELQDLLADNSIPNNSPWLGVQFIGDGEVPIVVGSNNTKGKYRETGAIYIHVVNIAKLGVSDSIVTRAEILRDLFRGQRIGDVVIESVSPVNFESGAALRFEGGFMCGSFIMGYYKDLDL